LSSDGAGRRLVEKPVHTLTTTRAVIVASASLVVDEWTRQPVAEHRASRVGGGAATERRRCRVSRRPSRAADRSSAATDTETAVAACHPRRAARNAET